MSSFDELVYAQLMSIDPTLVEWLEDFKRLIGVSTLRTMPNDAIRAFSDSTIKQIYAYVTSKNANYEPIEESENVTMRKIEVYLWVVSLLAINNSLHKQTLEAEALPIEHPDHCTAYPEIRDSIDEVNKVLGEEGRKVYGQSIRDHFERPFRVESLAALKPGQLPNYRAQIIELATKFPHISQIIARSIVDVSSPDDLRMIVTAIIFPIIQDIEFAIELQREIKAVDYRDVVARHQILHRLLGTLHTEWKSAVPKVITHPNYLIVDKALFNMIRMTLSTMPISAMVAIIPTGENIGIMPSRRAVTDNVVSKTQDFVSFVIEQGADTMIKGQNMLRRMMGGAGGASAGPAQ